MTGDNFPAYVLLWLAISSFLIVILLVNVFVQTKIFNSSILFLEYETNEKNEISSVSYSKKNHEKRFSVTLIQKRKFFDRRRCVVFAKIKTLTNFY
jgi:hypothetical protein